MSIMNLQLRCLNNFWILKEKIKENVTVIVHEDISKEKLKESIQALSLEEKKELFDLLKE